MFSTFALPFSRTLCSHGEETEDARSESRTEETSGFTTTTGPIAKYIARCAPFDSVGRVANDESTPGDQWSNTRRTPWK